VDSKLLKLSPPLRDGSRVQISALRVTMSELLVELALGFQVALVVAEPLFRPDRGAGWPPSLGCCRHRHGRHTIANCMCLRSPFGLRCRCIIMIAGIYTTATNMAAPHLGLVNIPACHPRSFKCIDGHQMAPARGPRRRSGLSRLHAIARSLRLCVDLAGCRARRAMRAWPLRSAGPNNSTSWLASSWP